METPYTPISCEFHDHLLALATTRQKCEVLYLNADGEEILLKNCMIEDVYSTSKEEWLRLQNGTTIRLDFLKRVGQKSLVVRLS